MPRLDRRRSPGEAATPHQGQSVEHDTNSHSVQPQSVNEVLEWSDALDASLWLRLAAFREGFDVGYELGTEDGRRAVLAEEAAWRKATAELIHDGPSHAELEARRWGPGGRARAGDKRPGDYPGEAA